MKRGDLALAGAIPEELVDGGEEVMLMRDGVAVAKLVPVPSAQRDLEDARRAVEELRAFARGRWLDGLSIRGLIEEGRR